MKDDARIQLRELVEDHLSRGYAKEFGLIGMITGLAVIGDALAEVQSGTGNWAAILERLRAGAKDVRAAVEHSRDDASLQRIRAFAERQLSFATLLEGEIVRLNAGQSTLVR
ncbi:MAG: hypothetical protein ABI588_08700 [Arenimonas sp.]